MMSTTVLARIAHRAKPLFPFVGAVALALLPIARGGGGGGAGVGGLGNGNAQVNIESAPSFAQTSVADGSCTGGANTNTFFVSSVTITDSATGAFETFFFGAGVLGIAPGPANARPLPHGIPAGTYTFEETWDSGTHGADQCLNNLITLLPVHLTLANGANGNVIFEY